MGRRTIEERFFRSDSVIVHVIYFTKESIDGSTLFSVPRVVQSIKLGEHFLGVINVSIVGPTVEFLLVLVNALVKYINGMLDINGLLDLSKIQLRITTRHTKLIWMIFDKLS